MHIVSHSDHVLPIQITMPSQQLKLSFDEVRDKNLEQLKLLNSVIFPIKFPVRRALDACRLRVAAGIAASN